MISIVLTLIFAPQVSDSAPPDVETTKANITRAIEARLLTWSEIRDGTDCFEERLSRFFLPVSAGDIARELDFLQQHSGKGSLQQQLQVRMLGNLREAYWENRSPINYFSTASLIWAGDSGRELCDDSAMAYKAWSHEPAEYHTVSTPAGRRRPTERLSTLNPDQDIAFTTRTRVMKGLEDVLLLSSAVINHAAATVAVSYSSNGAQKQVECRLFGLLERSGGEAALVRFEKSSLAAAGFGSLCDEIVMRMTLGGTDLDIQIVQLGLDGKRLAETTLFGASSVFPYRMMRHSKFVLGTQITAELTSSLIEPLGLTVARARIVAFLETLSDVEKIDSRNPELEGTVNNEF